MAEGDTSTAPTSALALGAVALALAVVSGIGVVGALIASADFTRHDTLLAVALFGGGCAGLGSLGTAIAGLVAARRVTGAARSRALVLPLLAIGTWMLGVVLALAWVVWLALAMPIAIQ